MRSWPIFVLLALCAAAPARGQRDPLNAAYKPTVDCTPGDYPSNVSLTQAAVKLRQTADSPTSITGYGTTPLPCVTIYGTQNAFADFQAHIQAPGGGYAGLTFTMSAMSKSTGPGGSYTIPAPATSGAGDNDIVVYREAYAPIPSANQTGHIWFGTAANIPDVLVPAIDPYWHQTTAAFPVAVSAGNNQSVWIDVLVPSAAPSGWYSGTVTISDSSAGTIATLPVLLAVWQWPSADGGFMPSTPTLRTIQIADDFDGGLCNPLMAYTTSATCTSSYSGTGNKGPQYALDDLIPLMLDNRTSLASWSGFHSSINTIGTITALETEYANGATTTRLNTRLIGAQDRDIGYGKPNGPSGSPSTWVGTFVTNGWFSTNQTFQYLSDEPSGSAWTSLNTSATNWRTATTPMMPLLVTTDLASATSNSALNSIDWIIVNNDHLEPGGKGGGGNTRSTYNSWLASDCCSGSGPARQIWDYASCDPNCGAGTHGEYPGYAVDNLAPAAEAEAWMVFNNDQIGWLYYSADGCFSDTNHCSSPWGSQATSVHVYGDGNLLAVGTNSTNCSGCGGAFVNVSQPIWLPTIRLKLQRDGVQDYEYLHYLNSLGGAHATVVTNAINSWINNGYCFNADAVAGATVSDHSGYCPASGSTTFTGDITAAKIALGAGMQAVSFPAGGGPLLPPLNLGIAVSQKRSGKASGSSNGLKK
ncbi:MAG: hypothetical protein ACRD8A_08765 [Candidatus Acidiferrales bacterium]